MGEPLQFTREDWLAACKRLLPNLTEAEREALYRSTVFGVEYEPDPYLRGLLKSDR